MTSPPLSARARPHPDAAGPQVTANGGGSRGPRARDHLPPHCERLHKHAQQWARNLNSRLGEHEHGSGARPLQVARDAGIGWQLARTWPGDRYREGRLKEQGGRSASQAERAAGQVLEPGGQAQPEPPETGLDEPDRAAPARARLTAQWARTARPYLSAELEAGR